MGRMGPARMYNSSLSSLCDNAICLHILYISYGYLKYRAHLTIIFDTNNAGIEEHAKNLYPHFPGTQEPPINLISVRISQSVSLNLCVTVLNLKHLRIDLSTSTR